MAIFTLSYIISQVYSLAEIDNFAWFNFTFLGLLDPVCYNKTYFQVVHFRRHPRNVYYTESPTFTVGGFLGPEWKRNIMSISHVLHECILTC